MSRLLRWLFLQRMKVPRESAILIARDVCERRELPWDEPIRVHRNYGNWSVWTRGDHIGGNVRVIIDGGTGEVRSVAGPFPL